MKIARHAQGRIWMRLAQHHRARQSPPQFAQAKPTVETVRSFRQAEARVLALPDRAIAATVGAFDVAQQYVDPSRSRTLNLAAGAAAIRHQYDPLGTSVGRVRMIGLGQTAEAEQPIRACLGAARRQMARLPGLDAGIVEAAHWLGDLKDCASEQGRLMPAGPVLVVHLPAAAEARAPTVVAAEALQPARPTRGAIGLCFGTVLLHELEHRQFLLELHEIDRHGVYPRRRRHRPAALSQIMRPGAEIRGESSKGNRSVVLRPQLARCDC